MANTYDNTALADALKTIYVGKAEQMVLSDNPLLSFLPKSTDFGGEDRHYATKFNNAQTATGDDATIAQDASVVSQNLIKKWKMDIVTTQAWTTVADETLKRAASSDKSFLDAASEPTKDAIIDLGNLQGKSAFGNGYGKIGAIASRSGSTITLDTVGDSYRFNPGMRVVFAASESSDALRDTADYLTVSGVDTNTGVITFSTAVSNIAGLADGDVIFVRGTRQNSATPAMKLLSGLDSWLPATAPSSTLFWGVDRTAHLTKLGGNRVTGSLSDIEGSLQDGAQQCYVIGGKKLDAFVLSFNRLQQILKNGSNQVIRNPQDGAMLKLGFQTAQIITSMGPVELFADRHCPDSVAYGLKKDTWELFSMGKLVQPLNFDGGNCLRSATSNSYEFRFVSYANIVCKAPGYNCRISLS